MSVLQIKNPYSNEVLGEVTFATPQVVNQAVNRSVQAFRKWRLSSSWERAQLLLQVAAELEGEKEDFSQLICREAGKPILAARGEVDRALGVLRWAAAEAQRFSGELLRLDTSATGRSGFGIHTRFPRGVILGITPYNFPLNLAIHKIAPAIACGCSILVKPSPSTPLTALRMAQYFEKQMPGLVQVIMTDDSATADLTRRPEISLISFTGSSAVGWKIRAQAPEKPTALELGGNAWVFVLEDTPSSSFPLIARKIANGAFGYAGQSCISVQNVGVSDSIWDEFSSHLAAATVATGYGDPSSASVLSGPLIHQKAAERVLTQIKISSELKGAQVISSDKKWGDSTPFSLVPPTLIQMDSKDSSDLKQSLNSSLVQNEVFGPVMTMSRFSDISEIIQRVNSSHYGLQAGVFTENWPKIERLYQDLEVGGLVVNDVPTTRYDHQPYGGVKESGQGREGLKYAMEEMTESKFLALGSIDRPLPSKV